MAHGTCSFDLICTFCQQVVLQKPWERRCPALVAGQTSISNSVGKPTWIEMDGREDVLCGSVDVRGARV